MIMMRAAGIKTFKNNLSEIPEGSLLVASNVNIDRDGVIEPRRGLKLYGDSLPLDNQTVSQIIPYKNSLIRHFSDILQFDTGNGVFSQFSGVYSEIEAGYRMKYIEANGNLYFTTNSGIKKISAQSSSNFSTSPDYITTSGGLKGLDLSGILFYESGGFFIANMSVAYRVVFGTKDVNSNVIVGAPSSRLVLINTSSTLDANVILTFTLPREITTNYFYQIFRTAQTDSASDPGDEMNLVTEGPITSGDITAGEITVKDITPDDFRQGGLPLYTNPTSGEGILQANTPPPLAKDMALYRGSVFYANTSTFQRRNLSFLSVEDITSGVSAFYVGNSESVRKYIFVGEEEIQTIQTVAASLLNDGDYFLAYSALNERKYCIYIDITDSGGTPSEPNTTESAGSIFLKLDILAADTDAQVATKLQALFITINFDFSSSVLTNTVTIENTKNGQCNPAADSTEVGSTTGFIFNVTQTGEGEEFNVTRTPKIQTIQTIAGSLLVDEDYFLLYSHNNKTKYCFYFNITDIGPIAQEPINSETTGSIFAAVNILSTDTDAQVATKLNTQILVYPEDFSSTVLTNTVTVTNTVNGFTSTATDATPVGNKTNFIFMSIQDGEENGGNILLSNLISPAQSVDETARSLVKVLNEDDDGIVNAFYLSGPEDIPGLFLLESRNIDDPVFSVAVNESIISDNFDPDLPVVTQPTIPFLTSVVSDNEIFPNRVYYSKYQQPEAVPLLNYFDVGPRDKAIERIIALRDSLFVFKQDGIYRITGSIAPNFSVSLFDNSAQILSPDSAAVLNNQIYFLSSQGIGFVSETGYEIISRDIENDIKRVTTNNFDFRLPTFGVGYETDRAYLIWLPTLTTDTIATQCFRFNVFTNTWTKWDKSNTSGVVNPADDKLYLGAGDVSFLEQERKNLDIYDYSDREEENQIVLNGISGLDVRVSSVEGLEVGDAVSQQQTLTISTFNRLLMMLDDDGGVFDEDYLELLAASEGQNLATNISSLCNKLDSDPGVADSTFLSSISGGSSFADIQSDFNIITTKLNANFNTFFNDYETSEGTTIFNSLITSIDEQNNILTLIFAYPFIAGEIINYIAINTNIVYAPQTFGNPATFKQISYGTMLFEKNTFTTATLAYSSDLNPGFVEIAFAFPGEGIWGGFDWGEQNWGGEGNQVPFRTLIPRECQRCRFLNVKFGHRNALEKFSIYGLSFDNREVSTKAYR